MDGSIFGLVFLSFFRQKLKPFLFIISLVEGFRVSVPPLFFFSFRGFVIPILFSVSQRAGQPLFTQKNPTSILG